MYSETRGVALLFFLPWLKTAAVHTARSATRDLLPQQPLELPVFRRKGGEPTEQLGATLFRPGRRETKCPACLPSTRPAPSHPPAAP